MKQKLFLYVICAALVLLCEVGFGEKQGNRKKTLDFEGDVVEGMNRQPLDSLTSVADRDKDRSKNHLYRRQKDFRRENRELAEEIVKTY